MSRLPVILKGFWSQWDALKSALAFTIDYHVHRCSDPFTGAAYLPFT